MNQPQTGGQEQGQAGDRSYMGIAFATFLCYFACYFPGLILNLYWIRRFSREAQATGRPTEGQGVLIGLLIGAGVVMPVVLLPCLGLMAGIAYPSFLRGQIHSRASAVQTDLRVLATAVEAYYIDNNEFPAATTLPEMTHDFDRLDETARRQEQIPTFARRNWHSNADPGVKSLTTPVAYLARMPSDPFATSEGAGYRYWHDENGFILWSPGPRGEYAITDPSEVYSSDEPQPSDALLHRSWDPTNGTISPGDIWRVRQ